MDDPSVERARSYAAPTILRIKGRADPLLLTALLFYWCLLYLQSFLPPAAESTSTHWLTVLPIGAVASVGLTLSLMSGNYPKDKRLLASILVLSALAVLVASVVRDDAASVRSMALMALVLLWLGGVRHGISVSLLNLLFCVSVLVGAVWFGFGFSDYGLLPGQYLEGEDRGIQWRVSLFPHVPESSFFALIVFLANQRLQRGWTRIIACGASLYFVIFSGLRSAIVALLLAELYILWNARARPGSGGRAFQIAGMLVSFVAALLVAGAFAENVELPGGVLGNFLFRSDSMSGQDFALGATMYRAWLWMQHLELFASSPLIGIGTFDFGAVVSESLLSGVEESGSESFLTAWLARVGLCFLPFLVYLSMLCRRAAASASLFEGAMFLVLGVATLAYGSFLVPYNFMFIVLFVLLVSGKQSVAKV